MTLEEKVDSSMFWSWQSKLLDRVSGGERPEEV